MTARKPFDLTELATVLDQWIQGARERLDEMIDSDASVIDIRDTCIFLSGSLSGAFQMVGVPIDTVNESTHRFMEELDAHLLARLPQHPGIVWNTNLLN